MSRDDDVLICDSEPHDFQRDVVLESCILIFDAMPRVALFIRRVGSPADLYAIIGEAQERSRDSRLQWETFAHVVDLLCRLSIEGKPLASIGLVEDVAMNARLTRYGVWRVSRANRLMGRSSAGEDRLRALDPWERERYVTKRKLLAQI